MARTIRWERWKDPFARLVEGDVEGSPEGFVALGERFFRGPAALTPLGVIPINEDNSPSSLFDLWVGHTDFELDIDVSRRIADEPGVEGFDVLSRYRFRIAVGRNFQAEAVKKAVELSACAEGARGLSPLLAFLRTVPDYWALVVFADGRSAFLRDGDAAVVEGWLAIFGTAGVARVVRSWAEDF